MENLLEYLLSSKIVLHIKYKYRSRCVFGGGFCALSRGVVPGGAMVPPDFGRSLNPISTRGTDYAHLIATGTLGFSDLPTALLFDSPEVHHYEEAPCNFNLIA